MKRLLSAEVLACGPEGEFAPKKGRPNSYLETIDIVGLEAALASAPSMRSTERKIKSDLRQSALSWTTFETNHPYSAEDAGSTQSRYLGQRSSSSCFRRNLVASTLHETIRRVEDRGGKVNDSDSEVGRTCMMRGSSFDIWEKEVIEARSKISQK